MPAGGGYRFNEIPVLSSVTDLESSCLEEFKLAFAPPTPTMAPFDPLTLRFREMMADVQVGRFPRADKGFATIHVAGREFKAPVNAEGGVHISSEIQSLSEATGCCIEILMHFNAATQTAAPILQESEALKVSPKKQWSEQQRQRLRTGGKRGRRY